MKAKLQDMVTETFAQLNALKALPEKANAAQVRYAANHIVRKSPIAKFFEKLGITNGSQIKRSFNNWQKPSYLAAIAQLYYIEAIEPGEEWWEDTNKIFSHPDWGVVSDWIFQEFCNMEVRIRHSIFRSMGKSYDLQKIRKDFYEQLAELDQHNCYDGPSILKYVTSKKVYLNPTIVALYACFIRAEIHDELKEWLQQYHETILRNMVTTGFYRKWLSHCHNLDLNPTTNGNTKVFDYKHMEDQFYLWTGISHALVNNVTALYQASCKRILKKIDNCEFIDEQKDTISVPKLEQQALKHMTSIHTTSSITETSVPGQVNDLAQRLAKKHGPVTITNEASGLHIYLADPDLLMKDGRKELASKHLAINAEKYLGIGRYDVFEHPTKENKVLFSKYYDKGSYPPCAISMKTKKIWDVQELLTMLPLDKRLPELAEIPKTVLQADPNKHLVYDEKGNLVPRWVGKTIKLSELPSDHPAIVYLLNRGYDIKMLEEVYDVSYCIEAEPENRATYVYYARLPAGRKNSTACRIIFPIYDENGVRHGWQARCIDVTDINGEKWLWTDQGDWLQITKGGEDQWISDDFPKGFKAIQKYKNAQGSSRNTLLFGLKQAIEWNEKNQPPGKKFCVLVEGPLDVGKGGPPCIALLGKSMSPEQAAKIRAHFDVVGIVADNDEAGRQCLARVRQQMTEAYNIIELSVPEGCKDLGDCTQEQARQVVNSCNPNKNS